MDRPFLPIIFVLLDKQFLNNISCFTCLDNFKQLKKIFTLISTV